jgi:hypothetical protein
MPVSPGTGTFHSKEETDLRNGIDKYDGDSVPVQSTHLRMLSYTNSKKERESWSFLLVPVKMEEIFLTLNTQLFLLFF